MPDRQRESRHPLPARYNPAMTAPLDYAPPTPWHRRRKPRRATILVAILLGLAITTYFYGPGVYRRASILYWQHRCMTFDNSALAPVSFPVAVGSLPPAELEALSSAWGDRALANDLTRGYYYRDIVFVHRLHGQIGRAHV